MALYFRAVLILKLHAYASRRRNRRWRIEFIMLSYYRFVMTIANKDFHLHRALS
jgi:hypothetical protein